MPGQRPSRRRSRTAMRPFAKRRKSFNANEIKLLDFILKKWKRSEIQYNLALTHATTNFKLQKKSRGSILI